MNPDSHPDHAALYLLTQVPPGEPECLPDDEIDAAVRYIRDVTTRTGLACALAIGQYLLTAFFAGDFAQVHAKGRKNASMRALASRSDLGVSAIFLWRSLAILEQWKLLPGETATALPYTHHLALLPLRDPADKIALATTALDAGWSSRDLLLGVRASLDAQKAGTPVRSPRPSAGRTIHGLQCAAKRFGEVANDEDTLRSFPSADLAEFERALNALIDQLDDWLDVVKAVREEEEAKPATVLALVANRQGT